jgi:MFS family permease
MSERYYPWAVVAATVSLIFFAQGAMFILAVELKPITADLGWPREAPSLGHAAAFFGAGVGALYFSQLSERLGVARIAALGAVSVAVGVYLTGLAREPWHVWVSYGVFVGLLGNACMFTPLIANIARWFERHRGVALGIATCGQSLGGTVWPPVVTWINGLVGWRETFQIYAAASLLVMIPLTLALRRRPPTPASVARTEAKPSDGLVLGLRPQVMTAALSFAIVCCCVPMSIPLVHLPAHGTDLGFAPQAAAALLSVALFASLASRVLGGALADRIGGLRTLFIGSAIQCGMLAVIAFERDLWTLYAVCLLYGLGYGGIIAMYAYILREYFPPVGLARRMAVVYLFGTFGMAAGGWIGGRIFDAVGSYQDAFLTGVAANLVNLLVIGGLILRAWRVGALRRSAV